MTKWDLFHWLFLNADQHSKINQCNPPCQQAKEEKSFGHIN
jgi:hypothetical protein